LQAAAAKPDASQILLESGQKELESLDKRIQTMEENAQKEGREKLIKKLQPINEKVSKALEEVSKEIGGVYVFRRESALFVVEENNISDLVLKKLGVTPPAVAGRGSLKNSNKLGYFNQNKVVPLLPEFKKVQKDTEIFREFLKKEMEKLQQDGQKLMAEVEQMRKNPAITEAQLKPKMEELQKIDAKLQELQQSSAGKVQDKYAKLMEPVIKTLQTKVDEVAKENGCTYVFRLESSLFEPKEADISDLVLKKFGITPPVETPTEKKN
jgi:Skp family chaperone for outer membrane proteins